MSERWPDVVGLRDGQPVNADTFNPSIDGLTCRTDVLKRRIDAFGGKQSVTVDAEFSEPVSVGNAVCVDPETGKYRKAVASMSLYDAFTASERAFAVGMVSSASDGGASGTVCLCGYVDLTGVPASSVVGSASPESGQYYLSSDVPGVSTLFPGGPRVSVGFLYANPQKAGSNSGFSYALVNPQHSDMESHAHRTYVLCARPSGNTEEDGFSNVSVPGFKTDVERVSGEKADGVPYLRLGGCWTCPEDAEYEVSLSGDGSWPCTMSWRAKYGDFDARAGSQRYGSESVGFFGDVVRIGSKGLTASLWPCHDGDWSKAWDLPSGMTVSDLSWTVGNKAARGWSDASVSAVSDGGGVVLHGVSDREENRVSVHTPEYVVNLSDECGEISSGDTLSIGDLTVTFARPGDANSGADNVSYIAGSDYLTLVAMVEAYSEMFEDGVVAALDGRLEQAILGLPRQGMVSTSSGAATDISCAGYAIVEHSDMESLSTGSSVGGVVLSVTPLSGGMTPVELSNGMSMAVVSDIRDGGEVVEFRSAPAGSVYRYAIEMDNDLSLHFPPVPAKSGSLMLNGVELESRSLFGDTAVYEIGGDSLYWRDGRRGRTPWPESCGDREDAVDTEDECRLAFHLVSCFHSETGPVTSIRPAEGSPITVRRCGTGDGASVGDLELDVDMTASVADDSVSGYKAVKASRNGKLLLGPVVERLVAGPGIEFSRTPGQPEGQGTFTVSVSGAAYSGDFETVAYENAKLAMSGMFPYTRLLEWTPRSQGNVRSGFVAKFHVPATAAKTVYRVRFYATVFGETSFSGERSEMLAGVRLDYGILPDVSSVFGHGIETANLRSGVWSPETDIVLDIPFGSGGSGGFSYEAYDPILVHNDPSIADVAGKSRMVLDKPIPDESYHAGLLNGKLVTPAFGVMPGYTVALRFSRTDPSGGNAYTGRIGFMNLRWSLEQALLPEEAGKAMIDGIVNRTVMDLKEAARRIGGLDTSYDLADAVGKIVDAVRK